MLLKLKNTSKPLLYIIKHSKILFYQKGQPDRPEKLSSNFKEGKVHWVHRHISIMQLTLLTEILVINAEGEGREY